MLRTFYIIFILFIPSECHFTLFSFHPPIIRWLHCSWSDWQFVKPDVFSNKAILFPCGIRWMIAIMKPEKYGLKRLGTNYKQKKKIELMKWVVEWSSYMKQTNWHTRATDRWIRRQQLDHHLPTTAPPRTTYIHTEIYIQST